MSRIVSFFLFLGFLPFTINAQVIDIKQVVNECQNSFLTLKIIDAAAQPIDPARFSLWVYDLKTGQRLWPIDDIYTAEFPGSQFTLNIGPHGNRVIDRTQQLESHVITVTYEYGSDCSLPSKPNCKWGTDEFTYQVKKLKNVLCAPPNLTPTYGPTPMPTKTATATATVTRTRVP